MWFNGVVSENQMISMLFGEVISIKVTQVSNVVRCRHVLSSSSIIIDTFFLTAIKYGTEHCFGVR
jgi:hypothetical protein